MTKELDAAPGDIRSLKYRIHELEGEVIGYKRILDGQGKAKPVAVAHVGNMDHGPFDITPTAYGCDHLKNGDKLYTSPPDPGGLLRDALAQSIIAENARGLRESNEGIYAHPDTLQRAAFEAVLPTLGGHSLQLLFDDTTQREDGLYKTIAVECAWRGWQAALQPRAAAEPVGWKHDCAALCMNGVELWIDRCPHCGKPRTTPPTTQAALTAALEALRELASCGAEAWSADRPCVKDGYAAIAQIEALKGPTP